MGATDDDLVKALNGLKYEQRSEGPTGPGQFVVGDNLVTFTPRVAPGSGSEPVAVVFEKEHVKEMREVGGKTKKKLTQLALEPELITYLFDESREKRRLVRYDELPDHLIKAVLAIEDRRFFSHPGLDPFRIVGAAPKDALWARIAPFVKAA